MDTQERTILYYLLTAAGVLAVLLFVFITNVVRHYRRNQRLHQQLNMIELTTLENERRRIMTDLHDEFGPLLTTTKLLISNIPVENTKDAATAAKAMKYTDTLFNKVKQVSLDLLPGSLSRRGLIATLQDQFEELSLASGVHIELNHPAETRYRTDAALHLYRIIQEAVNNCVKYAAANNCIVAIEKKRHLLQITITDDGNGFRVKDHKGNGLNNIALRAEILKGKMYVESKLNGGTQVMVEVPVKEVCN